MSGMPEDDRLAALRREAAELRLAALAIRARAEAVRQKIRERLDALSQIAAKSKRKRP
jgi:hypothetical protein